MNKNVDYNTIIDIYERFVNGELTTEETNGLLSVFTEMKTKEEYHKRKLLSDFNIDYNKDTDRNYLVKAKNDVRKDLKMNDNYLKPRNSIEAMAMGIDSFSSSKSRNYDKLINDKAVSRAIKNKENDIKNKNGFHHNGTINIGKDQNGNDIKARVQISKQPTSHNKPNGYEYININKTDLSRSNVKDLKTKLSHEIGHHSDNSESIPKRVIELIDNILGKGEEKIIEGNRHTNKSELIADYRMVKRVGKEDALKTLYKSAKDAHRNHGHNTHEGIDQDIKLRSQFIKSLTKEDLK